MHSIYSISRIFLIRINQFFVQHEAAVLWSIMCCKIMKFFGFLVQQSLLAVVIFLLRRNFLFFSKIFFYFIVKMSSTRDLSRGEGSAKIWPVLSILLNARNKVLESRSNKWEKLVEKEKINRIFPNVVYLK